MVNRAIDLEYDQTESAVGTRRVVRLSGAGLPAGDEVQISYEHVGEHGLPRPPVLDGFALGVVFMAMRQARTLRVHGPLSRGLCCNLAEFQAAWAIWRPERYRPVEIVPDELVDETPATQPVRAISAFSGGVDGTFTAIRHSRSSREDAYPLTDVMMVHGFDVPLTKQVQFEQLAERVRPLIDELGLNLHLLRTDLRAITEPLQVWEDSFGALMASALHTFSSTHRYALLGSGEPYSNIYYPWGSTPATDHLLSGDRMSLILDGSGFSRNQKCELIATCPTALRTLKVCWEGPDGSRNCGHCEKCVRTKLNLMACGIDTPACFSEPFDIRDLKKIRLKQAVQVSELERIRDFARARGIHAAWLGELSSVLRTRRIKLRVKRALGLQ